MNLKNITDIFRRNDNSPKYIENASWLLFENILRMSVGLFVMVWVARYLGPNQFGLLSYTQSFVALFAVIAGLGLNNIIIRELVNHKSLENTLLGTAFGLQIFGALIAITIVYAMTFVVPHDSETRLLILVIASATIFSSFSVIDFYFQSCVMSKFVVYAKIITLIFVSSIKILLILKEAPLIYFASVALVESMFLAFWYIIFFYFNKKSLLSWNFDFSTASSLMKNSWPLILSGIVVTLYMKIDQVMIQNMLDSENVGQYAAAVRLSEIWYFLPIAICNTLFPAILNSRKISSELYYSRLQKLYDFLFILSVTIALPLSFFSNELCQLIYGSNFDKAGEVLALHIWSGVFVFLGVAGSKWFVAENLQRYTFYRTLAGAIMNISLNYILIPEYGIIGAAWATLVSQLVASYLFNIFSSKTRITFLLHSRALLFPIRKIWGPLWTR